MKDFKVFLYAVYYPVQKDEILYCNCDRSYHFGQVFKKADFMHIIINDVI